MNLEDDDIHVKNKIQNQINNIQIARLSAEEFTEAYRGERSFRRLQEAQIELDGYQYC